MSIFMDVFYFKIKSKFDKAGEFMKIKVKNNGCDKDIYEGYKGKIYDIVLKFINTMNIQANIIVNMCGECPMEGLNGLCSSLKKKHNIYLYPSLFNETTDTHLELVIYHELMHVKDYYYIHGNKKHYKKMQKLKNIEDFLMDMGYHSWTEFNACLRVNSISNSYKFNPTFLDMVKEYEQLLKIRENIETSLKEQKPLEISTGEYVDRIYKFIYFFSRTMAAIPFKKQYSYCEKTKNKESFKKVDKLYKKSFNLHVKMLHGTYGKYLYKRLYKIGDFWYNEVFKALNISLVRYKKDWLHAFTITL